VRLLKNIPWWQWLLAAGVVVGLLAGAYFGNRLGNAVYTSSAQVLMTGQGDPEQPDTAYTSNQYVNQRMTTYAQVASSAQVTGPAAQALGTDPVTLAKQITATVAGDTTVLSLDVTGPSPDMARRNSVAVTQSFINAVTKLETNPGGTARVVVNVITDPTLPPSRSVPAMWLLLLGGFFGGLILAVIAIVLLRWFYPQRFTVKLPERRKVGEATSRMMPVTPPPGAQHVNTQQVNTQQPSKQQPKQQTPPWAS
jgi:capsular polysaccharide biosynthesis protein